MGRTVNNNLLVALSAIGYQQAAATEETSDAIEQLLDCVATYLKVVSFFEKAI